MRLAHSGVGRGRAAQREPDGHVTVAVLLRASGGGREGGEGSEVCCLLLLLGEMVLCELGETLRRIEGSPSIFKAGNEDTERAARANVRGWSRHRGLHGGLGCWRLERVVDLA
jgi:hypothetical protein